jgi:hypothetical protein
VANLYLCAYARIGCVESLLTPEQRAACVPADPPPQS